jgi:bacteriorhodopsin
MEKKKVSWFYMKKLIGKYEKSDLTAFLYIFFNFFISLHFGTFFLKKQKNIKTRLKNAFKTSKKQKSQKNINNNKKYK